MLSILSPIFKSTVNHRNLGLRWIQITARQLLDSSSKIKRPPVVTIMGHVDHGKTTLLDHLRNSQIVEQEFGGITQHIGAFVVPFKQTDGKSELVTFLDTPGHAAFAAMRQRGANVTDIVVLVIACEDGILDQTVESIQHAKAGEVPIIVVINKIDKFSSKTELDSNLELIRTQLKVHDIITELDGGEVQIVCISALKGIGIEQLKESILALAETLDLKSEIDCRVSGAILESKVDAHRGKLSTILVQRGILRKGDYVISGKNWAKIRALFDERAQLQQFCGPGLPIQVTGWREKSLPAAGDMIVQVQSENEAKKIINDLKSSELEQKALMDAELASKRAEEFYKRYKEKLIEKRQSGRLYGRIFFNQRGVRPRESEPGENQDTKLNIILKCDVDGSLDALLHVLDTYDPDDRQLVKLDLMHYGVGSISDNDLVLASSFPNSVIYGFNVKPANQKILLQAKQSGVQVKMFNVIYHLIDDLKLRLSDKLPNLEEEVEVGRASVLQEFIIDKKFHVAGCRCNRGVLQKDLLYRLMRNNDIIANEMKVKTMKHLKDDVKEIDRDKECGMSFLDHDKLEFKPGDLLIAYKKRLYKPKLKWDLKGFS